MRSRTIEPQESPLVSEENGSNVRFTLSGLVTFSVALVFASGLLVLGVMRFASSTTEAAAVIPAPSPANPNSSQTAPAWGHLITADIQIENPDEYLGEFDTNRSPSWIFANATPDQVRGQLATYGLTSSQIESLFAANRFSASPSNTVLLPPSELVLRLAADTRAKLYADLGRNPANHYQHFPNYFPNRSFDRVMADSGVTTEIVAQLRPLLYQRGETQFFSDHEALMPGIKSPEQRQRLIKALSRQPAVIGRLHVGASSDVSKLLGYWTAAPGVRLKDLRPLLESLQRLPEGGSLSLLYLLPPFARERLYTFPLPPKAGDPAMDCHWSSLNFFNEQPDDRFGDPGYAASILTKNYYPVQKPGAYGDVVVLVDEQNRGLHSAVFIAEDLVFTKNGNNHQQPWLLMRLNHLLAAYSAHGNVRMFVYRQKSS